MRGRKKVFHANGNQKKARVAILIPDKIDFIFFIEVQLIYNVVLVSGVQQSDSVIYMYMYVYIYIYIYISENIYIQLHIYMKNSNNISLCLN